MTNEFEQPEEELVATTPSQRNWKGILIALLVICGVCLLILFSIYLVRPPDDGPRVKGRKVTLEDITHKRFSVQPFNGSWISENELLFRDPLGGLSVLNADTLIVKPFVANTTFRQLNTDKFSVSADRNYILFVHEESIQKAQHFYRAKYTIYDIENEFSIPLVPSSESSRDLDQPKLQSAVWMREGNAIVFVYNNDIYYKPTAKGSRIVRITRTGEEGVIFNGIPDFLYEGLNFVQFKFAYKWGFGCGNMLRRAVESLQTSHLCTRTICFEEEILGSYSAIWASDDSHHILYAQFNDSLVGESTYPFYGEDLPYPRINTLRYPKAGTNNPVVTLWGVNLKGTSVQSIPISPPASIQFKDHYLTGVKWINNGMFVVVWMNRLQNLSAISLCRVNRWSCEEIYSVKAPSSGWLDFIDPPHFSADVTSAVLRVPLRDGEAGEFWHIIWLDIATRKEIPVTQGPYEVTAIKAWDQSNNYIYFLAAPHEKPSQRHLYQASPNSSNSTVITAPLCLTCPPPLPISSNTTTSEPGVGGQSMANSIPGVKPEEWIPVSDGDYGPSMPLKLVQEPNITQKTKQARDKERKDRDKAEILFWNTVRPSAKVRRPCLFVNVIFAPNMRFYVKECLGPDVPVYSLHSAPLGRQVMTLDNNSRLQEEVDGIGTPLVRTFQVNVTGGFHAPVRLTLPPGLLEEEDFKFPLVLHVRGTPGSQLVSEKWEFPWASFLSSEKNFIVAEIDGRGTGFQGQRVKHAVYKRLGSQEVMDQIEVLTYLKDNLHFIDEENMAVWGAGYGGYLAVRLLADESNLFRCGIAISPISKWEFYKSAFTERYMGMPNFTDNYRGYEEADLVRLAEKLQERNLLIIHGTADDSYQHAMYLTKALIRAGVSFSEQVYPDEGGGLEGVQEHLYDYMYSFIEGNFDELDFGDYEKANFLGIRL